MEDTVKPKCKENSFIKPGAVQGTKKHPRKRRTKTTATRKVQFYYQNVSQ